VSSSTRWRKPRWCRRCRTTAVTYWRRAVSAAGSLNCQAAGAPTWSSIATTKLRVSGWSSTMKTGDEDGAENVNLCQ